jgi:effector-binding domain-containing protein
VKNAIESIDNFETYLGSTKLIYGYDIQKVKVKDTAFIFGADTVSSNEKLQGTVSLYKKLIDFSKEKNAVYNGVRIFHSQPIEGNKVMLFAGIGIKDPIITKPSDNFQYKGMPGGKNLLVVEYEGKYSEIPEIYAALKKYIEEHKLITMAIPFEKFISKGFGFADSQRVNVIVTYPVF